MRCPRIVIAALLAAFLAAFIATPALAWTDTTRRRMVDDALKLVPPALSTILHRYRADLVQGMTDPSREETGEEHRQRTSGGYGLAARMIASRGNQAVTQIGQPGRLRLAAYAMGTVAHFVADVNFPPNGGDGPAGDPVFYASYQRYVEKILGRFPVVLDRKASRELKENRLEDFGRAAAVRASAYIPSVQAAYTPDGRPRSASAFDERSLPFGVASLCYSHTVNDIARVWAHIWREAGGDMQGLPFSGDEPEPPTGSGKRMKRGTTETTTGADQRPR